MLNVLLRDSQHAILWQILTINLRSQDRFEISKQIIEHALVLLRFLAQRNSYVQKYLFEHLDALLKVEACGNDQALMIAEVRLHRRNRRVFEVRQISQ